ncbi:MAG: zinc-binding dehydrogenase [Gemmatimonadota bacterium]|nr:zinc-binding dehydrogenase [Gemmatimonadota bacterium]
MRAASFEAHGGPEGIVVGELPDPEPGKGEVLVEVRAAALNHLDLWVLRGLPGLEVEMPHIGGSDLAGVVAATGAGVEGWETGRRVVVNPSLSCGECDACVRGDVPLCRSFRILGEHTRGGLADLAVVPARNLRAIADDLDFPTAAAAALVYQTAWRALMTRGRLEAGETVLVTGASGGVSTAGIQIAKHAGATVFAVTSGPENVERVRALGADLVIDRLEEGFSRRVWQETGKRGVDLVLDSVGATTFEDCVRCLAPLGRLVVYGATTGPRGTIDIRHMFWRQYAVLGSTMGSLDDFERVMSLVEEGVLEPVVDEVLPLDRAREAYERLAAGGVFGKLVLTP